MRPFLLLLLLLCFVLPALAQGPQFTLSGQVTDSTTAKPVEFAVVSLKNSEGKIVIAGATDADGRFALQTAGGSYTLTISLIGYRQKEIPVTLDATKDLGSLAFAADAKTLGEAVITEEKNIIVRNSEKTVFNVAQSPSNQTGTAEDVLRNMPGVSVDQNGRVSIINKKGVKILVDGRPNALAEADLGAFLKSIPANSIESIELITNPSARYDAEGNAGIINIKLKKGKADGLNANISVGYGFFNRYNGNAAFNYRKNKFNIFGSYSFNDNQNGNRYIEQRLITVRDTATHYNLDSRGLSRNMNHSLKAGFDCFIDDKNTFTYTASSSYNYGQWKTFATSGSADYLNHPVSTYISDNDDRSHRYTVTNDLAFQSKIDTNGQELSLNLTHTYVAGNSGAPLTSMAFDSTGVYNEAGSLSRRTATTSNIHNVIFQFDYTHPLKWRGHKIETGIKNETTLNKNVFDAFRKPGNAPEIKDSLLSNNFNYIENIAAFYLIYSGGYKEILSWSAGLRAEQTLIKSNNNSVNRQYVSFFPSATLSGNIKEDNSLSLSYSRRVNRPQFHDINNAVTYIDQYSTWQGNPNIQPSFSHNLSLDYDLMVKKHMFNFEVEGGLQTNDFIESSRVDSNRITRGGVINGSDQKRISVSFYTRLQITKWWQLQMNHNYTFSDYSYKAGVNLHPISGHSYNLWLSTNFKFWKNMVFEINGWFNSGGVQPQGISKPAGMLNMSLKKSFFKDRFTVSVSAQNVLSTMKWRWTVSNTNLETAGSWQALNRTVFINLSYRFGQKKVTERDAKGNDRLGGGGGRQ